MQTTSEPDGQGGAPGDGDEIDIVTDDGPPAPDTVVGRSPQPESALLREIDDVIKKLEERQEGLERSIAGAEGECAGARISLQRADESCARAREELEKAKLDTAKIESEKATLETIRALLFQQPELSVHVALQRLKDEREGALRKEEAKLAELVKLRDETYDKYISEDRSKQEAMVGRTRLTGAELDRFNANIDNASRDYKAAEANEKLKHEEVDSLKSLVECLQALCNQGDAREQDILGELGKVQTRLNGALDVQQTKQQALAAANSVATDVKKNLHDHEEALKELEENLARLEATTKVLGQAFEMANRGEYALRYTEGVLARLGQVHSRYNETTKDIDERTLTLLETARGVRERVQKALCEDDGKIFGLQGLLVTRSRSFEDLLERLLRSVAVFAQAKPENEAEFVDGIRRNLEELQGLVRSPMDDADLGMLERDAQEAVEVARQSVDRIDPAGLREEVRRRDGLVSTNNRLSEALKQLQDEEMPELKRLTQEGGEEKERLRRNLAEADATNRELRDRIADLEGAERTLNILLEASGVETPAELKAAMDTIREASRGFEEGRDKPSLQSIANGLATAMRGSARPRQGTPEGTPDGTGVSQ